MAINYELINKGGISLGTNFELLGEKPLDARLVVPSLDGLAHLITEKAAYAGMIVYVTAEDKHYQVNADGTYREFGITADELKNLIATETTAAMEFKGATTELPENPSKGDMYKVAANFTVDGEDVKVGDSIVYNGEQWFVIPSGDDVEDTWRPVTGVNSDADLTFAAGDKIGVAVAADGTVTYGHEAIDAPELVAENEQTRTYITEVVTDGYGHITGYKTATENVEDTNTEYTFTSQVESSSVSFQVVDNKDGAIAQTVYVDAYSKNETNEELNKKLDKSTYETYINGKSMSDEELKAYAKDYTDGLADNYAAAEHDHVVADITDFDSAVKAYDYATKTEVANAKSGAETKAAELDAALKTELQAEIDADVKVVADDLAGYKTSNNEALAGVKATAEAAATKAYTDEELAKKVNKTDYETDKATFATKTDIEKLAGVSTGANKVEKSDTNGNIKIDGVETVVYTHPDKHSISDVTGLQDTLDGKQAAGNYSEVGHKHVKADITDFAHTHVASEITDLDSTIKGYNYATKTELGNVDAKFADYNTTAVQKGIDDAQDARIKAIEDDYLVADDIKDFETKANVKKVADDLAAYVESNDAALAAETKARTDADADFETRIAALEGNFGDGEGTVEAQIAAAVKVEKERAEGVEATLETKTDAASKLAEAKKYADDAVAVEKKRAEDVEADFEERIAAIEDDHLVEADMTALQEQITANANAITALTDGIDPDKIDGLTDLVNWANEHAPEVASIKEDIEANTKAIEDHEELAAETYETKTDAAQKLTDAKKYTDDEVAKDRERIGALEAVKDAYKAADTELHTTISKEIDDDVKAAIDAEVSRANGAYDASGAAATAKSEAIADAASKYETKGTAQGIIDGLKLSETYEPIGAESRAIAAAKSETESQVSALAGNVYTKSETYTKAEVEALLTWGEF